jgi:hypothetical protein
LNLLRKTLHKNAAGLHSLHLAPPLRIKLHLLQPLSLFDPSVQRVRVADLSEVLHFFSAMEPGVINVERTVENACKTKRISR